MFGLLTGDDITFRDHFRMSRRSFERLLSLIEPHMHGGIHTEETRATRHTRARDTRAEMTTTPTMAFRLAAVLYLFAHGGALQLTAHVASIGRSTLRAWAVLFCNAVMRAVHPIYMPYGPPPPAVLHHNRREFASRRGIQNIAMCVDGTHIPWRPYKVAHRSEYRNYKGWHSILCVAFVSPFHLFIDGDVGYPGRAGDNTVLNNSPLMDAIHADPEAWLGRDGLIIGDGGASDGDRCFLNPYHTPRTPHAEVLVQLLSLIHPVLRRGGFWPVEEPVAIPPQPCRYHAGAAVLNGLRVHDPV